MPLRSATEAAGNPAVCQQPIKVGPCKAAINRWAFDPAAGKCVKFSWGGCQANQNNFPTEAKCNATCK